MNQPQASNITLVLDAACRGDPEAAEALLPLVYDELRGLARARLQGERPGQTLQPTDLVHEAYLRVVGDADPGWDHRGHFFAAAGRAMRRILINQARRKARLRHGGDRQRVEMDDAEPAIEPPTERILDIDRALQKLEARDPRQREIVNLRYFAGLTAQETAAVLKLSVKTVEVEWTYIKAWLQRELADSDHGC